jgi:hypothetical protein
MVAGREDDNFKLAHVVFYHIDCRLGGLGAGVQEERFIKRRGEEPSQPLAKLYDGVG